MEDRREPTYENQLWHANKVLKEQGREELRRHARIGRDCGCGSCFCCAAAEVLGKLTSSPYEPAEVQ